MDPLAALSLAANVTQFFDFAWELFSEACKIHRSAHDASDENVFLKAVTSDVRSLTRKLRDSPTTAGDKLKSIALMCQEIAGQILKALDDIKAKGSKTRWRSFLVALERCLEGQRDQGSCEQIGASATATNDQFAGNV